jgi:hypothetical protein
MPNFACPAMPRGSWQRPITRLSAALNTHVSPHAAALAPGSAKAIRPPVGTDEDEDEDEASNGRSSSGPATPVAAPVVAARRIVGGGPMT